VATAEDRYDASERRVKKPGKPKPKRRNRAAQKAAVPAVATTVASSGGQAAHPAVAGVAAKTMARGRAPGLEHQLRRGATSSAAAFALRHDDRMVLGLLLLPFLLVAFMLSTNTSRRNDRNWSAEVAVRTPAIPVSPQVATQPVPSPVAAVPAVPTPTAVTPTALTPNAVQPIAPAPSEHVAPPVSSAQITLPGSVVYPPPLPMIEAPVRTPDPEVIAAPVLPAGRIVYPPPPPEISIAALDVRQIPQVTSPSLLPSSPPAPSPTPPIAMAPVAATPEMCAATSTQLASFGSIGRLVRSPRQPRLTGVDPEIIGQRVAAAAVAQTRDLVIYTARYQPMAYPMGDVVSLHGACIDVVIRAYRAVGIDLQEEVQKARPGRGDPNIDHRRTENMRRFLEKHGTSLPITHFPENYKPGDIVTYHRPFSRVSTPISRSCRTCSRRQGGR
jgi:uncharacterized protein YijF (DUF1287 family)